MSLTVDRFFPTEFLCQRIYIYEGGIFYYLSVFYLTVCSSLVVCTDSHAQLSELDLLALLPWGFFQSIDYTTVFQVGEKQPCFFCFYWSIWNHGFSLVRFSQLGGLWVGFVRLKSLCLRSIGSSVFDMKSTV